MATGSGNTRTAAALIKQLFEANAVIRALFLVDRIRSQSKLRTHSPRTFQALLARASRVVQPVFP